MLICANTVFLTRPKKVFMRCICKSPQPGSLLRALDYDGKIQRNVIEPQIC